jgi:hypothetical protein
MMQNIGVALLLFSTHKKGVVPGGDHVSIVFRAKIH